MAKLKLRKDGVVVKVKAEDEYEEYFEDKLEEEGVDSPADIPDEDKDEFFEDVDDGYNSEDEAGEDGVVESLLASLKIGQTKEVKKGLKHLKIGQTK